MQSDDRLLDEAAAWAVRTGDAEFGEWEAFTSWLEQSPAHAAAYDHVSAAVTGAAESETDASPAAANDDRPKVAHVTRRWFGGAIAASLAALVAIGVWQADSGYTVRTAPGETRMIVLDDGGRIELAGGTRIELDRDTPRFARLVQGRALFTISHDEARPFRVEAGEDTLLDIGTVFEVALGETGLSVAVAKGAVIFNPKRQAVRLHPGDLLRSAHGSAEYERLGLPPEQVGEWREGRLTFHSATLGEVAGELGRATGLEFRAAPGSSMRLSGSILVAPVRQDPRAAGTLLGVSVRPQGDDWVIAAP